MANMLRRLAFQFVLLTALTVEALAQATQVRVETQADGSGVVVPAQNLASGDTLRVYAISRTLTGVFVANVAATWTLDSLTGGVVQADLIPSADGKSAILVGRLVGSAYIRATSGVLTPVPSGKITVVPGPAVRLRIVQQPPATATAGVAFSPQPVVRVEDANGNVVTTDNTTTIKAIRLLGTGTLLGDTSRIVVGGVATFTSLRHNVAETINIRFTSNPALTPDTSINILVNPGPAARLIFVQQPTNDTAGTVITPPITVQVKDAMGNNVGGVRPITMAIHSGTGVLSGTTTQNTNASGLATFSNLSINLAGTKVLKATSAGLDSALSASFVISPAAAARLNIQTEPSATATAGVPFTQQPIIRIEDPFGNLISTDNTTQVTAARAGGTGTLQGTTTRTAVGGIVTFTDLRHTVADTITIRFTSVPTLTPDTSSAIVVNPAAPKKLVFAQQPTNDTAGVAITPPITVQLQDTFSNNVSQSGVPVQMSLTFGTGTLSGTTTQSTNATGLATFANLSINLVGRKVLTASSAGLTSAVSDTFTISPGPPATIVATTGTPQSALVNTTFATRFEATVRDAQGNLIPGRTVTFTAPTTGARGTFQGGFSSINVVTDSVGVARATPFTANTIAGSYAVTATVAGVATPATFSLTNTPGPPRQIAATAGTPQSTQIATAFPVNFRATVRDTFGNPLSNVLVRFTRPSSGPSGTFFNNIDSAFTDTGGVATAVVFVANFIAGSYNVTASAQGVPTPAVFSLTNLPGPPATITAIAGTPQSTRVGTAFAQQFRASVKDGANNAVPNVLVRFRKPATGPSGTFAGGIDTVRTDATGVATAPVFTANLIAGSYTDTALVDGVSTPALFQLTNLPGAPGSITIVAGNNQSTTVNTNFSTAFSVVVRDSAGNAIPDTTVTFTAPSTGASGKFGASRTALVRTNSTGVATAPTFTADTLAGSYQVSASAPGVATPALFNLTNVAGPAARITATAGTPQSATIGTTFSIRFRARVTDQFNNPKGGLLVTWTRPTTGASGTFQGNVNTATTDSATGVAEAQPFTANLVSGSYVVTASVSGVSDSASFFLTNTASAPRTITAAEGILQSTTVNTAFTAPLLARVEDQAGNPVPNALVTFTAPISGASGRFANDSTTYSTLTDSLGFARTTVRANTIAGGWNAEARVSGVGSPAIFSLTNTPGAPSSLQVTAGNNQEATVNTFYGTNFAVTVRDAFGNPTPGVLVRFIRPTTGPSGTFNGNVDTARTNSSGVATAVPFRANTIAGFFKVAATVNGGPPVDSLSLRNSPAAAKTVTVVAGTPQQTVVNTPFPTRLTVVVRDTFSNPVSGVLVTFNVPPQTGPSGTFAGGVNIAVTDNAGIGTAEVLTANRFAGQFAATATVTGVSVPAQFVLTNLPGAPWSITAISGTPQSARVMTMFPDTMKALVRDSSGNPVPDIDVTFVPPDTGATGSFQGSNVQRTGPNGVAVAPAFVANFRAGAYVVRARVGLLTPAIYSLRNTPADPHTISTVGQTNNQSTTVGTQFPLPLQALVLDQFGNPVPGREVTFVSPSTGPSCNFPSSSIGTARTDSTTGIASIVAVANTEAGSYNVTATVVGAQGPTTFTLTNTAAAPATMFIQAGNNQSAQVGTQFPINLQVLVRDGFSNPVPNALVRFTPPTSGPSGTFQNGIDTVRSGPNGVAQARPFTANSIAGGPYTVRATALGGTNPTVDFQLTNTSGPPGRITILAGAVQSTQVATPFAVRFRVRVRDADSNNVPNAPVQFSAPPGGPSGTFPGGVTGAVVNTDSSGIAEAPVFTANNMSGRYVVQATAPNVSVPVEFQLTNLPAPARYLQPIEGTPQQTQVGTAFPIAFKTKVVDEYFNPIPNALVRWLYPPQTEPSGTFAGGIDSARTHDSTGIATAAVFVANFRAGQYQVKAVSPGVQDTARYDLRNLSGAAASITAESGTPQTTRVNTPFGSPFSVVVRDQAQNPVEGVLVRFTAPLSGASGAFENGQDTARTNSAGVATSARFIANRQAGQYAVRASTEGVSQTASFHLTNVATTPMSITAAGGTPQATQVNTLFPLPLRASVRDTFDNPVPNTVVIFTPPTTGPSGSFEGGNAVTTNDSGLATSNPFRANSISGSYVVQGTVQGLNLSVNYDLTNTTGQPASIAIVRGRQQAAVVNTVFDTAFTVRVTDNFGNPVGGVNITFTAPSSGPSGTFSGGATSTVVQTDVNGIAAAGTFRANTIAGSYSVTASNPSIGAQAMFDLTNLTGPLNSFLVEAEHGGAIGLQLAKVPFNIRISARDAFNNLVQAYNDSVTITSTGSLLAGGGVTPAFSGGVLVHRVIMRSAGSNVTITARRTSGGTQSGTSNAFQVNNPVPRIASVQPANGSLLDTLVLTVRGSHFIDSLVTSLNMGTNITVNSVIVDDTTQLRATITIGVAADTGSRLISVSNAQPGGGPSNSVPFVVEVPLPRAPLLGGPPDSGRIYSPITLLSWSGAPLALSYRIQVATDVGFGNIVFEDSTLTTTSIVLGPPTLQHGGTYFWRVRATNPRGTGEYSRTKMFTVSQAYPSGYTLNTTVAFPTRETPGDYLPADYRLVGFPGDPSRNNVRLDQLLSGSQNVDWVVFRDNGAATNYFVPFNANDPLFNLTPGRAFWVLKRGPWTVANVAVPTTPLDTNSFSVSIPLQSGWNIITNPYTVAVPWNDVRTLNGIIDPIYGFAGTFQTSNTMQPYTGYYFFNAETLAALRIPYGSPVPGGLDKGLIAKKEGEWKIGITFMTGGMTDATTSLGVVQGAAAGLDATEYRKPRAFEELPAIYFHRPEWDEAYSGFAVDYRPAVEELEQWPFEVHAPRHQQCRLTFDGVADVPPHLQVFLLDEQHARYVDLRSKQEYGFSLPTGHGTLKIVVGTEEAVRGVLSSVLPKEFALGNNFPNPFNPTTTIPIAVPHTADVTLKIYNILGEEVRTIFSGTLEPGRYFFAWDGKNDQGISVATGVYISRFTTKVGKAFTRKMMLVK